MSRAHKQLHKGRWARVRLEVLERDGWRCRRCGCYGNEVDHIRPLRKGGDPFDPDNLQTLCRTCHVAKTRAETRRPDTPAEAAWRAFAAEPLDSG